MIVVDRYYTAGPKKEDPDGHIGWVRDPLKSDCQHSIMDLCVTCGGRRYEYFKPRAIIVGSLFAISLVVVAVAFTIFCLNPALTLAGPIGVAAILSSIVFGILTLIFVKTTSFYSNALKRLQ